MARSHEIVRLYDVILYYMTCRIICSSKYSNGFRSALKNTITNYPRVDGIRIGGVKEVDIGQRDIRSHSTISATMPSNEFRDSASDTHRDEYSCYSTLERSSVNQIIGSLQRILSLNCMKRIQVNGIHHDCITLLHRQYIYIIFIIFLSVFLCRR